MTKGGKHRGPTASIIPSHDKRPKSMPPLPDPSGDHIRITFRDMDDLEWGDGDHHIASFAQISQRIREHEKMTWAEVMQAGDHSDPIDELCAQAKARLIDRKLDDHDRIFRLRFTGLQRLWGVRDGKWFRVLWWDPCHKVRPVALKNT